MENVYIKPNGTVLAKTIALDGLRSNFLIKFLLFLFWLAGLASIISLVLIFFNLWPRLSLPISIAQGSGASFVVLALFLFYLAFRSFYLKYLLKYSLLSPDNAKQKIASNQRINLFDVFSFDLGLVLAPVFSKRDQSFSLKEMSKALVAARDMKFILIRLGLSPSDIINYLEDSKENVAEIIKEAINYAISNKHNAVWSGDLFFAICKHSAGMKKMLSDLKVEIDEVETLVVWETKVFKEIENGQGFFNITHLKKNGGIGKDWAYGYTNYLNRYSLDITEMIRKEINYLSVVGRNKEINQIEEALLRTDNANVIIVGNAGVGKHTTILGFAKKVIAGEVDGRLAHSNIYQINTEALISGSHDEDDIIGRFSKILEEASFAGHVILLIEDIDNLFSNQGVGTADLTEVLLPYLSDGSIHIIGTSEVGPYNEFILANTSLAQHFTRITVNEPSGEDLLEILEETAPTIEYNSGSIITYEAIKTAIKDADRYMINMTNPEKTIGLLEGASNKATSERGKTIVLSKDIEDYVSEKFAVPSAEANEDEKQKLLQLEKIMHETVIGQDEAIEAVANAMRRARTQVSDSKKPIGSFLFLGPTGVGKTATAKALARAYFGGDENMIRFDMSEYQNSRDIYRLIGTDHEAGNLTTFVSEKPFSLLLFDEIEKCNPEILNLFLQILDEGVLTDGKGKKTIFTNTIIIATSNAGSDLIHEAINGGDDYNRIKLLLQDYLIKQNIFKPELLNRFTSVVAFAPLDKNAVREVAKLVIAHLEKTVSENKGVIVKIDDDAIDYLAELGFDPEMGARPMERVIQDKIENLLAKKILNGELGKGSSISITKEMIG